MLVLNFEVLDGDKKGRHVFARLNLENPSAIAVQIAQSELSSICRAVRVLKPTNEYDLINRPIQISVYVDDDGYNGIGNYAAPGQPLAEARAPRKKAVGKTASTRPQSGSAGKPDDDDDDLPF
jgi:hypothetical protein